MSLPGELRGVLAAETAEAWEALAPAIPEGCRLGGGTALAVHLGHRESRDLDFFFEDPRLDLDSLVRLLRTRGELAVARRAPGTLNCQFGAAKLQFLSAAGQQDLDEPLLVQGIAVLGLADVFAMKIKVIGDRGELRDYFDLQQIELLTGRPVEEGIGLYMARYAVAAQDASILHIVAGLGYLDDVDEDGLLPEDKAQIASYWRRRQPEVLRNISRYGPGEVAVSQFAAPVVPRGCTLNCFLSPLAPAECACSCASAHHGRGRG